MCSICLACFKHMPRTWIHNPMTPTAVAASGSSPHINTITSHTHHSCTHLTQNKGVLSAVESMLWGREGVEIAGPSDTWLQITRWQQCGAAGHRLLW